MNRISLALLFSFACISMIQAKMANEIYNIVYNKLALSVKALSNEDLILLLDGDEAVGERKGVLVTKLVEPITGILSQKYKAEIQAIQEKYDIKEHSDEVRVRMAIMTEMNVAYFQSALYRLIYEEAVRRSLPAVKDLPNPDELEDDLEKQIESICAAIQ